MIMKAVPVAELLFIFCVVSTLGQTTRSPPFNRCFLSTLVRFGLSNPTCAAELQLGLVATEEALDTYCSTTSGCTVEANDFFVDACNIAISDILCAQNEDNTTYCVTGESIENAILVVTEVIDGVCMRTNCTDVTCNAAVANLTCCVSTVEEYIDVITGVDDLFPELPDGCTARECIRPPFEGSEASTLSPLPGTLFFTALAVVLTTLH